MKKRPLLFIILGILHLLEPLIKILYLKIITGFPFAKVMNNVLAIDGFRNLFEFWLLFPIGGLALLFVKNWSYLVFVAVQIYSIMTHLTYEEFTWPYVSETPFLSSMILMVVNVIMIVYFAFPSVRRPFLDKRVRWWETKKRYAVKIPCQVTGNSIPGFENAEILNISKTGLFLKGLEGFNLNETINIKFSFYNLHFTINGVIRSRHKYDSTEGCGVEFVYEDWKEKFSMARLIRILKLAHKNPYGSR